MPGAILERGAALRACALAVILAVSACGGSGAVDPVPLSCGERANDTEARVLECMTLDGVMAHLEAWYDIAMRNGGTRTSGTEGYLASVDYAQRIFEGAGYQVERQSFPFSAYEDVEPSVLSRVSPLPAAAIDNDSMEFSGSGDVTAPAQAVPAFGCNAGDFAAFSAGSVALIRRGECSFTTKAGLAQAAGAVAVVVYNNEPGGFGGALEHEPQIELPVVAIAMEAGEQLVAAAGLELRVKVAGLRSEGTTYNLIADSRSGNADTVVVVGAHLDSVRDGPGINDNGSGSAAVLETAVQLAKAGARNRLRFALWGAEELGLLGSAAYVESLSDQARDRIAMYLNFDMLGSPNPGYFIYDGDNSDGKGEGPGPAGSEIIEKAFEDFYAARGKPVQGTDFDGRSDYGPFIEHGIPAGGVFSGGDDAKSAEQAALWGGTAGMDFDPCYHKACDNLSNIDRDAFALNSAAVAAVTLHFANEPLQPRPASAGRQAFSKTAGPAYVPPADMRPRHLKPLR
ncbi:Leupeptin-inactivating enzyme 1 precursor [Pigmentiphaga humi]|uniref:Leupeptin-inactivating enzyme 1 n=1 Tax=Pigmentiphaga humi TaxID=2478468 RepID=A0A3P4B9K5_9BURK|nr:M28 family peptidase [Pigmentiphaga humi]VCU72280.1 Leupeptin-inactivating enzyme 1 precursor [Pigmentiphaga humi]